MITIVVIFLFLHIHLTQHASIGELSKNDCTYKDGRFGRIDLSTVGLKHGIPAFRHIPKDDHFYS
jgi:hypothetical protein